MSKQTITKIENTITLSDVIRHQSQDGGWICPNCIFYKGNLHCKKNMFISFEGCFTKDCRTFQSKKLKP